MSNKHSWQTGVSRITAHSGWAFFLTDGARVQGILGPWCRVWAFYRLCYENKAYLSAKFMQENSCCFDLLLLGGGMAVAVRSELGLYRERRVNSGLSWEKQECREAWGTLVHSQTRWAETVDIRCEKGRHSEQSPQGQGRDMGKHGSFLPTHSVFH